MQIQDLQTRNNMDVNDDYRLLGCKTMQLADILENMGPPSSRLQGLLTPATDGTVHHQAQQSPN
jgi:hypothetical protein